MLFYYWACVADNDTTLNQQRITSLCSQGTLNMLPIDKQISVYSKVQKPSVLSVQILAQMRKCETACESAQVCKCISAQVRKCSGTQVLTSVSTQVHKSVSAQVIGVYMSMVQVLAQVHNCLLKYLNVNAQVRK